MSHKYLITAPEINQLEGVSKTHLLNNNAQRVEKSLGDLTGLTGIVFHLITVFPGFQSTEYHKHHNEDYCVYIQSGIGLVTIGSEEYNIGPGDFIGYRAGGLAHTMRATGDEPLTCIVVGQRLDHEIVDYPNHNVRICSQTGVSSKIAREPLKKSS